jgi:hypothetical protein
MVATGGFVRGCHVCRSTLRLLREPPVLCTGRSGQEGRDPDRIEHGGEDRVHGLLLVQVADTAIGADRRKRVVSGPFA